MASIINDESRKLTNILIDNGYIDKNLITKKVEVILELDELPIIKIEYIAERKYEDKSK